jgi:hypothetical protein
MAVHDDRRTPRDYIRNARSRYDASATGTSWAAVLIGLAILAFIAYMLFAGAGPDTTGDATRQAPNNTTTTAPIPPAQPQPQGQTGPTNTTSGGAPASSPQGDSPPGMQPDPKQNNASKK